MTGTPKPRSSPGPGVAALQYGSRTSAASRAPSAGVVTRPISGLGKLGCGRHDLEVLSRVEAPTHWVLVLANAANHCHAEAVTWLPDWLTVGTRVRATLGFTAGYVTCRDVDRYQARDARRPDVPLTDWLPSAQAVFEAAQRAGLTPATTCVLEVQADDRVFVPTLYRDPAAAGTGPTAAPSDPGRATLGRPGSADRAGGTDSP